MAEYIDRDEFRSSCIEVLERIKSNPTMTNQEMHIIAAIHTVCQIIDDMPAEPVVPWQFLERYADYFCAVVSMPEFVREAKDFYQDTYRAMQGGYIGGADE